MVKISMMPLRGLPFGVRLNARLGLAAGDERLLSMATESCTLVEVEYRFFRAASEKHDLVATLFPCEPECSAKDSRTPPFVSMLTMGDNVFDQRVWPTSSREVWNDHNHARGQQLFAFEPAEVPATRVRHCFGPNRGSCSRRWRRLIALVKVFVERENLRQFIRLKFAHVHFRGLT
jgi:hypothetical protein